MNLIALRNLAEFTGDSKDIVGLRNTIDEKATDLFKKILGTSPSVSVVQPQPQQQQLTFDNVDTQEKENKRNEEREEARKALEKVRFGVKAEAGGGLSFLGSDFHTEPVGGGIMINIPYSRLQNGNLVLATELNGGFRWINGDADDDHRDYKEFYLNIPLMFQYVSFFYPTSDIQVHWVPSPKRHVFMHLKTIAEAGAFIDIPLITTYRADEEADKNEDYKEKRNFFDLGIMVGGALQIENIILGARVAVSYTDFFSKSSSIVLFKGYLGYLF